MPRDCSLCESPASPWGICSSIESQRGPAADPPRFVAVKRELAEAFGIDLTVTELKRHVDEHIDVSVAGACLIRADLFGDHTGFDIDEPPAVALAELAEALPDRALGPMEAWAIAEHPAIDALHGEPLDTLELAVRPDDEERLIRLWIEEDGDLLTFTLVFRGVEKFEQYSPTMDFSGGLEWELSEVQRTADVTEPTMLTWKKYLHVPPLEAGGGATASHGSSADGGGEDEATDPGDQSPLEVWQGEFAETSWTPRTPMSELSTDEVVRQLGVFGIDITQAKFRDQAETVDSPSELVDHWEEAYPVSASGFEEDFVWLAAAELWERLTREGESTVALNRQMQRGYELKREGRTVATATTWLAVWEQLSDRFTAELTDVAEADAVFSGAQSISNWCQDVEFALLNAGSEDPRFYEELVSFGREFCAYFPETSALTLHNMRRSIGEALFRLGRIDEAEEEFRALIEDDPDDEWSYIRWGDMYAPWGPETDVSPDPAAAERIYRRALGRDVEDEEIVRGRVAQLEAEGDRPGERPTSS